MKTSKQVRTIMTVLGLNLEDLSVITKLPVSAIQSCIEYESSIPELHLTHSLAITLEAIRLDISSYMHTTLYNQRTMIEHLRDGTDLHQLLQFTYMIKHKLEREKRNGISSKDIRNLRRR